MAYNRQNYYDYEQDKMCYSEQSGYGRPTGYGMRPHHNNANMGMTECESYTVANSGYGQGGGYYAPTPKYNSGSGACYERKEKVCMSSNNGRHNMSCGHRRRRVMRHSESRGSYSSSESDSD